MTPYQLLSLICIAFAFMAGLAVGCKHKPRIPEPPERVKIDTIWVEIGRDIAPVPMPQPKIRTVEREKLITELKEIYHTDTVYKYVPINPVLFTYDSLVHLDSLQIRYRITSLGLLKSVEFGYRFTYPSITITERKSSTGLYIGGFANTYTAGPSAYLVRPTYLLQYGYGLDNSHTVGVGVRIGGGR
jgi:hypothetical protein